MIRSARIDRGFANAFASLRSQRPPFLGVRQRPVATGERETVGNWLRNLLVLPPGHPVEVSEWVNPDCRQAPHLLVLGTTMEAASLRLYLYKAAERVAPTDVSEALARGNAGHRLPKIARTFDEPSGEPQAE